MLYAVCAATLAGSLILAPQDDRFAAGRSTSANDLVYSGREGNRHVAVRSDRWAAR
jgi:hypothetical protein